MARSQKAQKIKNSLPSTEISLPVVAIRQGILFPNTESVMSFGRDKSVKAIKDAADKQKLVVLVAQKDPETEDPKPKDLYQVGTLAMIERTLKTDDTLSALVRGLNRVEIINYLQFDPYIKANVDKLPEVFDQDQEADALASHLKKTFQQVVQMGKPVEFLSFIKLMSGVDNSEMTDQIASTLNVKTKRKQELLETVNVKRRMKKVISSLTHEMKVLEIEKDVVSKTQQKFNKTMRDNILRERLKTIKKELGEIDEHEEIAQTHREKLEELNVSQDKKEKIEREINRLEQMSPNNPEAGYIRTWLDTVFDLPWGQKTTTEINLEKAEKVLNQSHYGLEDVKDRVLEYIAVMQLKQRKEDQLGQATKKTQDQEKKSSKKKKEKVKAKSIKQNSDQPDTSQTQSPTILCFVGPPGVGKTSIGKAIAQALNRKFTKISLGGIRDEAEIRGHRRTYVGAMPGRIIKGIQQAGSTNPVFILDEIDKVGNDFRGDPSAALLEALDPEQNESFEDHYLDMEFDLSDVIFITTANTLDTIPPALRDRLEIIRYPGYTYNEKFEIAKRHLLDKVLQANGLDDDQANFTDGALEKVIRRYTKEAGVRELERKLGKISRKAAKQIVEKEELDKEIKITKRKVKKYLGPEEYDPTIAEEEDQVGVATGLAWTSTGGDILFIEVALTPGKGKIKLTGKLGDVMKESAQAAVTFVKSQAKELKIDKKRFEETDIHIHVPEGAVPKDGPSAGITIATAIASAFTDRPVEKEVAMTGEITLRGRVLRIGGLKEKAIAGHLAGISSIIIPAENKRNLVDIPDSVKDDIKFKPVKMATEALELALKK
ncbi:MAG: endopeptidase La [Candidatus Pacebacteria bacterium]|nr:endopeptidase La [Candidatus Paceibacterota bacterium]